MVMEIENGSAFESVAMSTISITFMIMSIISCMSRELALVWMDGLSERSSAKRYIWTAPWVFQADDSLVHDLPLLVMNIKQETKYCFLKSSWG